MKKLLFNLLTLPSLSVYVTIGELAASLKIPVLAEHRAEDDSATLLKILDHGLKTRTEIVLDEIIKTANGTYHFDGTRKP